MNTPGNNPFIFPGMGQGQQASGMAGNPLLQSFEMMRHAWSSMGGKFLPGGIPTPPTLNIEDLDRRIAELRTVENWLRLNLSMLEGSIQAMEVQRATIATLQSFAHIGADAGGAPAAAPAVDAAAGKQAAAATSGASAETAAESPSAAAAPAQAWWNMLQQQFNQLASAAAATLTPPAASSPAPDAKAGDAPGKPAAKTTARKTSRAAAPRKNAASKP